MICITGATGFLGKRLVGDINDELILISRTEMKSKHTIFLRDIDSSTSYSGLFDGVECIIHCAAKVHAMGDSRNDDLFESYKEVNTCGTINLAKQAVKAGVKRFIYISSIKVNGESTKTGIPFSNSTLCAPNDPYGRSKAEAEEALFDLSKDTGLEVVIIRPPLVYGAGVKGNFSSLLRIINFGGPMPFGCINKNSRSLVSVKNLVDLIVTCIDHPRAANQTFLVSDDYDLSTSYMVREMAKALGKPTWQLPVPVWCYDLVGKLFGKSDVVDRLVGSLQVDITHTKETLGWKPPQTLEEGFKETAQAFLNSKK